MVILLLIVLVMVVVGLLYLSIDACFHYIVANCHRRFLSVSVDDIIIVSFRWVLVQPFPWLKTLLRAVVLYGMGGERVEVRQKEKDEV